MRSAIGKVFISYSSRDKTFVRKLDRSLRRSGYDTWLDEHELVPGDSLTTQIAAGVNEASVVLVVVSKSSIASRWLRYELNLATNRMIQGACRVIPLVVDNATLLPEVTGLLYADFRLNFRLGTRSLRTALQHEEASASGSSPFRRTVDNLVKRAFDYSGYVSLSGHYRYDDYAVVEFDVTYRGRRRRRRVFWDSVYGYGEIPQPLDNAWWVDFASKVEPFPESLFLVVTNRPISFNADDLTSVSSTMTIRRLNDEDPQRYVVLVDLGSIARRDWLRTLEEARGSLNKLAAKVPSKRRSTLWPDVLVIIKRGREILGYRP